MNVTELLDSVVSLPAFLLVVLIYGFVPGFLLRGLVLLYQPDDPRRTELITELYEVPYLKRPFWVAQQIETVAYEGLVPRIRWALTGRLILRWKLGDGVKQNRLTPETFWVPSDEEKDLIEPGDHVKLIFRQSDGWGERMWVVVDKIGPWRMVGYLDNQPLGFPRLYPGRKIRFRRDHIIDIASAEFDTEEHERHAGVALPESEPDIRGFHPECGSAELPPDEGTESAA